MTTDFTRESFTRPARNGDEVDAFAADHRVHGFRSGERASIKARANRRDRRDVRAELRERMGRQP